MGFSDGTSDKEPTYQWRRPKRFGFSPQVRKIPWRRAWRPSPVFLPGETHGQRSLAGHRRSLLYSSSVYYCHLFLVCSASVRPIPFLSFIEPIFAWNIPLVSLIFLKRSLVFPNLLFFSISLHWSLRKAFLSLLAVLWNSEFRWIYLSFSPLPFASLLFKAICNASSDSHFA